MGKSLSKPLGDAAYRLRGDLLWLPRGMVMPHLWNTPAGGTQRLLRVAAECGLLGWPKGSATWEAA